jgi:hypothetical protein
MIPLRLNKPVVGFRPIIEFCQEGERMEPEVSVPLLLLHNAATATPLPELEPPVSNIFRP